MFTAAIFDMDGLLLDSERCLMNAWLAAAREHGMPLSEEDFRYTVGRNSAESRAWLIRVLDGSENYGRVHDRVSATLGPDHERVFALKDGAIDLLDRLSELRVPCAVASTTHRPLIEKRLAAVDALRFFAAVAGSDEVVRSKPDPAVYLLAAQRIGVDPASCLVFEDSTSGATAALRAGMAVVIVPDLVPPAIDVALAVLPSLAAATPHVKSWFAA